MAKEREIQRRRLGQDLQSFKERQEESEVKKLQEERKRDKIEEQAARKRILEQIAQDKAERAQRFNQSMGSPAPAAKESAPVENRPPIVSDSTVARIQFKKPDGDTEVKTFGSADLFGMVRSYVEENVIVATGIREFALATSFPRKEFKAEDDPKTLLELGLVPSAVILILPLDKATSRKLPIQSSYGLLAMLTTIFWTVVNPLVSAFAYVRMRIFSRDRATGAAKRNSENELSPNDAWVFKVFLNKFFHVSRSPIFSTVRNGDICKWISNKRKNRRKVKAAQLINVLPALISIVWMKQKIRTTRTLPGMEIQLNSNKNDFKLLRGSYGTQNILLNSYKYIYL